MTFEIDSTYYEVNRIEFSFLDWLSKMGGLSSILLGISQFVGNMESAQMFATQSMFYPEDDGQDTDGSEKKQIGMKGHRPEDIQARCCLTCRAKIVAS